MAQYGSTYGGRANPFDQRNNASEQGGYGADPYRQQSPQYAAPAMGGRDEFAGRNVEMTPLRTNGAQFASAPEFASGPGDSKVDKELLEQCKQIDGEIKKVAGPTSAVLKALQTNILNNPDPGADLTNQRNKASDDIMQEYTRLVDKIRRLKSNPRYASNIVLGKINRDLRNAMEDFQQIDRDFTQKLREQMARQYRIVRPEASEAEVNDAVEGRSGQQTLFSDALMQSNRRGQAQSTMQAVKTRHEEIQKIEQQIEAVAQLFIEMNTLVVQQEAPIANIEMKGEEVVENMDKGNAQIGTAIQSARNTRKWKWWCLGIVVLIIVIIVIIVLIYKFVIQNNNTSSKPASKRFVLPSLERRAISATTEERSKIPGLKWTRANTLAPVEERWVVDKLEWSPPSKKERRFQA
ncbi:Protein SSO2 [Lachnellula arida]|uniref:Protein SSO2 n=1 Tax=Lachnellula arida TaxID=1316785 RepID=A0A8T9B398_9HELO|nr:Protein SSO2 [Lachnellula arida]